ncbi:hypothetical protein RRG08_013572 [Elysia crispata]|uniref:Uncharacterized protein n=1 Tax=Elysia crispata TaxID=231223 RepID=A0AAE0Y0S7_9GAST|nr:hypothetical protein RRG08_013572 [Elysia crispata]
MEHHQPKTRVAIVPVTRRRETTQEPAKQDKSASPLGTNNPRSGRPKITARRGKRTEQVGAACGYRIAPG